MESYSTGNKTVDQVGKINFIGNVIPHTWYKTILRENGKPNVNAIIILSDIVYWYRPKEVRDEYSGQLIGFEKKFKADALQRSYEQIAEMFGMTKRQASDAVIDLEKLGVIRRDFRLYDIYGNKLGTVLYILLNVDRLYELTFPDGNEDGISPSQNNVRGVTLKRDGGSEIMQGDFHYDVDGVTLQRDPYTKNKQKNSTKITSDISTTTEDDIQSVVERAKQIFFDTSVPERDIPAIVKAADYDIAKVIKAKELFLTQTSKINNVTGWIISAIENDYEVKSKPKKTAFNNISQQREYDFQELERRLLNK